MLTFMIYALGELLAFNLCSYFKVGLTVFLLLTFKILDTASLALSDKRSPMGGTALQRLMLQILSFLFVCFVLPALDHSQVQCQEAFFLLSLNFYLLLSRFSRYFL